MGGLLTAVSLGPVFMRRDLGTRTWRSGCAEAEIRRGLVLLAAATDSYFTSITYTPFLVNFVAALTTREYAGVQGAFSCLSHIVSFMGRKYHLTLDSRLRELSETPRATSE